MALSRRTKGTLLFFGGLILTIVAIGLVSSGACIPMVATLPFGLMATVMGAAGASR